MAALHLSDLSDFLTIDHEKLLGQLTAGLANEGFDTNKATTNSWQREIQHLQESMMTLVQIFPHSSQWKILLEYVIPIVGQRVDCILLANDIIFVVEYKAGNSTSASAALRQAQEYALNLSDFHEESRGRVVVPIALGQFKSQVTSDFDGPAHKGCTTEPKNFPVVIKEAYCRWSRKETKIDSNAWNDSRYFPVPTIIEAASAVYLNHDVKEIAYARSGNENLKKTQNTVIRLTRDAITNGTKKLIVITGVPGAGKTLAGLNAVQMLQKDLDLKQEQASFLSGNGPLVEVLREALKRSIGRRKKGFARSVQSRIREMHRFIDVTYKDKRAPADRLIVFDEAQRAWTAEKNNKKFGHHVSEPEMVLEIMGRHKGWAIIVALVGGGQEIHSGEAGLAAWGDAIAKNNEWEIITSPEAVHGGPSVAGSRLFRTKIPVSVPISEEPCLHLAISKRSFESGVTAAWVNALLDGHTEAAATLAERGLPVYITRDINAARCWLRDNAKGKRRAGLVASSGAQRLRAVGVEPPSFSFLKCIDYPKWFLEPEGDYRSSNQLEVALSEFELQGLEIDLVGLLWGGDLVFCDNNIITRKLIANKWVNVLGTGDPHASADDPRVRILNKYRVLLTRFRKGMVIFVPKGSEDDQTQAQEDFDHIYNYLLNCGVRHLNN